MANSSIFDQIYLSGQLLGAPSGILTLNGIPVGSGNLQAQILIGVTGMPLMIASGGFLGITGTVATNDITGNLYLAAISGALSTNLNAAIWVTGGVVASNDVTGNLYLAAISGALSSNLSAPVSVSGGLVTTLDVTGNLYLAAMSGFLGKLATGSSSSTATISNPIGVTGTSTDINATYTGANILPFPFQPIGGRAVNVTGAGTLAAYTTGQYAMLAINASNGACLVNQGVLDQTQDNVTTWVSASGSVSNTAVSGSAQQVLPALTTRRAWFVANLGTGALGVLMGASNIGTGNLSFVLKGGSANYDGNGASWSDSPAVFNGSVFVSGINGAPILYTAWQI